MNKIQKLLPPEIYNKILFAEKCFEWIGYINIGGYGQVSYKGKSWKAHRLVYELTRSKIPTGLQIDHLCRNRKCVNPDHLEPVTKAENQRRGFSIPAIHSRKTRCPRGHAYTRTYKYKGVTQRICDSCIIIRNEIKRLKRIEMQRIRE